MKKHMGLAAVLMLMVCLFATAAAAVPVPVKGVTSARGSVELLVTFYDRADGGKELHAATQTLPVIDVDAVDDRQGPRRREQTDHQHQDSRQTHMLFHD